MTQNDQENSAYSKELTVNEVLLKIKAYFKYLKSRRIHTIICGLIFAVLGLGLSFYKDPVYVAQVTFTANDESGGGGGLSSLASQIGVAMTGGSKGVYSGLNILPFLSSRLMIQKTLLTPAEFKNGKELLINHYIETNHLHKKWKGKRGLENIYYKQNVKNTRLQDSVLGVICKKLAKSSLLIDRLDKKSTIISMVFTSKDELFAKNFVEALFDNATAFYIETRSKKAARNFNKIKHQADSIRVKLNEALSGVAISAEAIPNANPLKQSLKVSAQRRVIDVETNRGALIELNRNLALAQISLMQSTPLIDFLDKPILPLEVRKIGKIMGIVLGFILGMGISISYLTFRKLFVN